VRRARLFLPFQLLAVSTLLATVACSDYSDQGGGVIGLEVRQPATDSLEVHDTLQLHARALDRNGDSIPADIRWTSSDTGLVVDSATGLAVGHAPCVQCTVRAHVGTLYSTAIPLRVVAGPDTLVVGATSLTVASGVAASAALDAQLLGGTPPAGVAGRRLVYEVVAPLFPDPATRTVELAPGLLIDTVLTNADGRAATAVTLQRVTGVAAPESAVVEVRAARASGRPVPGSGQRFVVHFQP
jgi:hypothetical protein